MRHRFFFIKLDIKYPSCCIIFIRYAQYNSLRRTNTRIIFNMLHFVRPYLKRKNNNTILQIPRILPDKPSGTEKRKAQKKETENQTN